MPTGIPKSGRRVYTKPRADKGLLRPERRAWLSVNLE